MSGRTRSAREAAWRWCARSRPTPRPCRAGSALARRCPPAHRDAKSKASRRPLRQGCSRRPVAPTSRVIDRDQLAVDEARAHPGNLPRRSKKQLMRRRRRLRARSESPAGVRGLHPRGARQVGARSSEVAGVKIEDDRARTSNRPIGSPVERLRGPALPARPRRVRRRRAEPGRAARRDPAQRRRARPHPFGRRVGRAEAARRARGHHRGGYRRRHPRHHHAAGAAAGVQALPAAGHRQGQGALRRRADRGGGGRQRGAGRGRAGAHRARHRSAAAGGGSRRRAQERKPAVRGHRPQSRHHAVGGEGRRRRGVQGCALHPPRALLGAALHRGDDGAARPAGGMGRGQGPPHRVRHDQGGVPQPPHPGQADGRCPRTPSP